MLNSSLYVIDYQLHGAARTFIIRAEKMDNAEACHWAACDVGLGVIPKFGASNLKKISRPLAERYGITDIRWRRSGST
ncbi:DUF6555 family protein [Pseudomonas sp.]|uniref:DUF6555 family protein n=1 Tax=Pseudomonas sp. TaxID=306 RepID=UPI00289BA271|nr:DUF6555 family protein [Pseudomonas sp.]